MLATQLLSLSVMIPYFLKNMHKYEKLSLRMILNCIGIFIIAIPILHFKNLVDILHINSITVVLFLLVACILAPIAEEMLFRGILVDNFKKYGNIFTIIVVALIFATAHVSYWNDFKALLFVFIIGLLLTSLRIKYNTLSYCIVVHLVNNLLAFSKLGLM
jgi:hypothetical protein